MRGTGLLLYAVESGPDGCPGGKSRNCCQAGPIFPAHAPLRIRTAFQSYSTVLRIAFHFSKTVGTLTDLLQHPFKLLQLLWREVLERTLDECAVPAKNRDEHFPPLFSQRNRSDPAITPALDAIHQPLLKQPIHCHADRA